MLRNRSIIALAAVVALAGTAFGQDADLKWKFEKGKTFYQTMTTETNQDMTVMGMKINQKQSQTFIFSWTPERQNEDKSWDIKQKIEAVKMDIQIGPNPITYDSTKDSTASNALSDFFKALVGAEFTLTVTPDGKVSKVAGREKFLNDLIKQNQAMETLLKQILSDDALKQMADPAFSVVPGKAVKKGDTWERKTKLEMGPIGTYNTALKYTDEGPDAKDKNVVKIKVDTTLTYSAPTPGSGQALPFKIVNANLKSKDASGTILFDVAKGRVASSDLKLTLSGNLSIDIGGMTSDVELNQTQTTTIKTTDENPVTPAKKEEKPPKKQ